MTTTPTTAEKPQDWYFTFGVGHTNAMRFVKIHGTFDGARKVMFEHFGRDWAFQYPSADGPRGAGVARWHLTELKIQE